MSLEKSGRKDRETRDVDINLLRAKGTYTQEGFYRKNNNNIGMNLSNLSQKQSIYDHKYHPGSAQVGSEIGYSTMNPLKYPACAPYSTKEQQYEILIEFQLKRQRDKNKILEERLKNKQIFISQMKQVQDQLTIAFKKCQEQLEYYKKKSSQPSIQARQYLQEINQLKHLVIRLEDKITEYQKKENKRYSSVKHQDSNRDLDNKRSVQKFKMTESRGNKAVKDKRSKTTMNNPDSSPQFKKFDIIEDYISKFQARITNFISRFLSMVQFFSEQAQKAKKGEDKNDVKKRLKISWKWIKQIVGQWNDQKNYIKQVAKFHKKLKRAFNIAENIDESQSMQMIMSALRV